MEIRDKVLLPVLRSRLSWAAGLLLLVHALTLTTLGTRTPGPLLSNLVQFVLGGLAIYAAYEAGRRSGPFGRRVWVLVAVAFTIWTVGQGIITVYDSILHASYLTRWPSDPLMFFWVVPLFMALLLVRMPGRKHLDLVQIFDFVQILILAMTAYLAFLYAPSEWQAAGHWMAKLGWDATNVRDAVLAGGLTARALFPHGEIIPALFRRLAVFSLLYLLADLVYHYLEEIWKVTTGSPWDLLWSAPVVAAIVGASTWDRRDETELANIPLYRRSVRTLLFLASVFLPLPVLLVALKVHQETPAMGAGLVAASLLCSGARLFITQRRRDQSELLQSALFRIAATASSCKILKDLCAAIHATLNELMYARNFYVALYDDPSQTLSFVYSRDEAETFEAVPVPVGRGLTEYVLRTGEPLLAGPELFQELLQRGEVESVGAPSVDWLGVPLKRAEKPFGVLVVQSYDKQHRYGEKDKDVLTFVAQHLASFIEEKRNEDALRESEIRFSKAFNFNPEPASISTLDDGRYLDVNEAFLRATGYYRSEVIGRTAVELKIWPNLQERHEVLQEIAAEGRIQGVELRFTTKGGEARIGLMSG